MFVSLPVMDRLWMDVSHIHLRCTIKAALWVHFLFFLSCLRSMISAGFFASLLPLAKFSYCSHIVASDPDSCVRSLKGSGKVGGNTFSMEWTTPTVLEYVLVFYQSLQGTNLTLLLFHPHPQNVRYINTITTYDVGFVWRHDCAWIS